MCPIVPQSYSLSDYGTIGDYHRLYPVRRVRMPAVGSHCRGSVSRPVLLLRARQLSTALCPSRRTVSDARPRAACFLFRRGGGDEGITLR
jgi:hypothetical protein